MQKLTFGTILFLFACLTNIHAVAQNNNPLFRIEIKGELTDSISGDVLPYATVALSKGSGTKIIKGAITGLDGKFSLTFDGSGSYVFSVRHLGYKNFRRTIDLSVSQFLDLGRIALPKSSILLDELTVKPIVEQTATEIIYNVDQDPDRQTSSLSQILDKVPLVQKRPDGSFYIDSPDKSYVIVRNGRTDALFSDNLTYVLQKLPAMGFSKIKLSLVPQQRYGNVAYVLNIMTDSTMKVVGAIGSANYGYFFSSNNHGITPGTTFSSEKLRGGASAGFSISSAPGKNNYTERLTFADQILLKQIETVKNHGESVSPSARFSYDLAKNQFLTLKISTQYSDTGFDKEKTTQTSKNEILQSEVVNDYVRIGNNQKLEFSLNYQYEFKKEGRILNLVSIFSATPQKSTSDITSSGDLINSDRQDNNKLNIAENRVQAYYLDPVTKKINFETYIGWLNRNYFSESSYFIMTETGNWAPVMGNYRLLDKKYNVFDGSFRLNNTVSKSLTLLFDLRVDYLNDGQGARIISGTTERLVSETGFVFNPSLSAIFMINKKRWNTRFIIRQSRPGLEQLNPYNEDPDGPIIKVGNPELKPQQTNFFSLQKQISIKKKMTNLIFSTSYSNNAISPYTYRNERGQSVTTYLNYGKNYSLGIGNSLLEVYRKGNQFNQIIQSNINYFYSQTPQQQKTESLSIYLMGNTNVNIIKGLSISLNESFYYSFNKGYQFTRIFPFSCGLNTTKSFLKSKLLLSVSVQNIFLPRTVSERFVNTSDFRLIEKTTPGRYPVSFSVLYNFGTFKVKPVRSTRKSAVVNDALNN
jgi:ferric enterobactin receptor